jgi:predicted nucleotidyltransferase
VRPLLGPRTACILFGSVARGTHTARSDIDLLVIAPTRRAASDLDLRIDQAARQVLPGKYRIISYTPGELRRKGNLPLVKAIREEGIRLGDLGLEDFA